MVPEGIQPDKRLAAVCGLFCPACHIFISGREKLERRARMAEIFQCPVEGFQCDGCQAEERFIYCQTCKLVSCAADRGLDFCGACAEYPCDEFTAFQAARPHRLELWIAQARIQKVGYEQWFSEMLEHYACPECGTINSAYHLACRECGYTPSCAYVAAHRAEIVAHLSRAR